MTQKSSQTDADGHHVPYTGINGCYRRTDIMHNFRWVYVKESVTESPVIPAKPANPGSEQGTAMWWTNVCGRLSWVLGQADRVGSDSIWAHSASQHLSPDGVDGPWFVYSYVSQCYEEVRTVEVTVLYTVLYCTILYYIYIFMYVCVCI